MIKTITACLLGVWFYGSFFGIPFETNFKMKMNKIDVDENCTLVNLGNNLLDFHLNSLEMLVNVKTNVKTIDFYFDSIMKKKGLNKEQIELLFSLN